MRNSRFQLEMRIRCTETRRLVPPDAEMIAYNKIWGIESVLGTLNASDETQKPMTDHLVIVTDNMDKAETVLTMIWSNLEKDNFRVELKRAYVPEYARRATQRWTDPNAEWVGGEEENETSES